MSAARIHAGALGLCLGLWALAWPGAASAADAMDASPAAAASADAGQAAPGDEARILGEAHAPAPPRSAPTAIGAAPGAIPAPPPPRGPELDRPAPPAAPEPGRSAVAPAPEPRGRPGEHLPTPPDPVAGLAPPPAARASPQPSADVQACVDAALSRRGLNGYGDPPGTHYPGGPPVPPASNQRYGYVLDRHPDIRTVCGRSPFR